MTIEDVCSKLNMSKWKIQRYLKKGFLRRHSSSINPYLTDANKKSRLKWCVDMIEKGLLGDPRFIWVFLTLCSLMKNGFISKKSEKYYLLPKEDELHRTCKNKNYNPRLMFLCVCARSRFRDGECIFYWKIGCFPLITYGNAVIRSQNHLRYQAHNFNHKRCD